MSRNVFPAWVPTVALAALALVLSGCGARHASLMFPQAFPRMEKSRSRGGL